MEDRRARILVVDDDDGVTNILERGLRREGYDVATAADVDRALETVRGWKPDALVLDVLMPGRDGLELCRIVRAERVHAVALQKRRDALLRALEWDDERKRVLRKNAS